MSAVDMLKAAHAALVTRTAPTPVVFHHVPKCGGTSVGRALRSRYLLSQATVTPEESFQAFERYTGRTDREAMLVDVIALRQQMMLYHLLHGVRCVSAHVPYASAMRDVSSLDYRFITILREPVERFISHYFWSHGKLGAHGRIEETLEAFLDTPRARRLGAAYVEFFCGDPMRDDLHAPEAIENAVANLRQFDVVGRLDDLPAFERHLKGALGVRVRIGRENRARDPGRSGRAEIAPELRARIETLCAPDLAVWRAVANGPAAHEAVQ
ncbi:MAG: sulfotransferase family 2 domain-containing protein [Oceanicaulis sp.]